MRTLVKILIFRLFCNLAGFQKLKDKFPITREEFDEKINPFFVFFGKEVNSEVVAYIEKNWDAFKTGKLQRPSQYEKDSLPVTKCHHNPFD